MDRSVLIDTSVWIFALRKRPIPEIRNQVDLLLGKDRVSICPLIILEILYGIKTKEEFGRLKRRLTALPLIEIDQSVWEIAYNVGFSLRRKGVTVPPTDLIIAATALHAGAVLLHADRHFDLIATETDLKAESLVDMIGSSPL